MTTSQLHRRLFLGAAVSVALTGTACAQSRSTRNLTVFKTPTCACCDAWITHMRQAGFTTTITVLPSLQSVRSSRGLPDNLGSCHTGLIDGYFVEGHVPAGDLIRLLAERPTALGLAVPAMPLGSPGMDTPQGDKDPYDTLLVLRSGATRVFARHNPPT
ncbi:hypothetical protein GCM10017620_06810 [Brevundimonas intermedia]|uniref:DUF411 domain-containing protein n=1 Tax=Brevundimonas intermedia TaxID=74315 RepID=A0ABQ5T5W0_9CAUL|nr:MULTISPECIES: DUF411 domain-containing protein [Brevundimonas]KQR56021.1 hypothetical protein ASF81_09790 [Brevundimonas sp. Leaf168]QYF85841.1 DUF411 domain-containing protein [Brevundimonas sp. PAMC22021]GLK47708.1 hypothetical protein GCM10017620_06810 [Brevundimonas intermedia]